MPTAYRCTAIWQGFQGAPGYTKLTFVDLATDTQRNAAGAAIRAYFDALKAYMSNNWNVTVSPTVQEFNAVTGELEAETTMSSIPAVVNGTSSANPWAAGSGYFVGWRTTVIFHGRRVQGRTFMVPAVGIFDTDGTLLPAGLTAVQNAAQALIDASGADLAIWAKRWSAATPPAKPVQVDGVVAPVTSRVVKDMASQLRSRRT